MILEKELRDLKENLAWANYLENEKQIKIIKNRIFKLEKKLKTKGGEKR